MKIDNEKLKIIYNKLGEAGLTVTVKYGELLKNHTSFKIGGAVRAMYFPGDANSAAALLDILCAEGITPLIMGNGSNILADDNDLDIVVVNTTEMKRMVLTDTVIFADCGVLLPELAAFALKNSLSGLEFTQGIPGTLGGAVTMNAGAYGGEMKDVVYATTAYGKKKHLTMGQTGKYTIIGEAHGFAYRSSVFARRDDLILSSIIHLKEGNAGDIEREMQELAAKRRESQPLDKPSAGSVFKRPKGSYAAALIDEAGLKGYTIGGAQVSSKHAGFIVNTGNATFQDVMSLIEHIQETVEKRTGVKLELEVKVWK